MSEKNIDTSGEKIHENQTVDRRTYLKLAGAAGSGLGAGLGTGALGTEFTTPVQAASTVVDDFTYSSGVLSDRYHLDQDAGNATVVTASTVGSSDDDSNVLEIKDGTSVLHAYPGDSKTDLNAYPEIGDTFSCWIRESNGTGTMNFIYGAKDASNKYYVQLNLNAAHLGLFKYVNGSGESLTGDWENSTIANNTGWFKVEIQWTTGHKHTVTLYQNGSQVTSFSYTEGSSDPKFTANGVGFAGHLGTGETAQFDYATTSGSSDGDSSKNRYKFADNFEDGNLDEYSFDRGESGASVVADNDYTGSNSLGGSYGGHQSLKLSGKDTEMISTSGLPEYPAAGDTFGCWVMAVDGSEFINITYGVQDHLHRYFVRLHFGKDRFKLYRYEDWEGHLLAKDTTGFSLSRDEWYWVEVEWKTDGTHEAYLYDVNYNLLSKISGTDSTWSSGGIGFDGYLESSGGTVYFDDFIVGKHSEDWKGGWGTQQKQSYGKNTNSTSKDVSYFEYFINNRAKGTSTTTLNDGSTVEFLDLVYNLGGIFHTYNQDDAFEDNQKAKYLDPINSQDTNEMLVEVQNPDSYYTDNGFDYIKRPAGYTYTSWLNSQEWTGWIDDNLHTVQGQDRINQALERNDNINANTLTPEWMDLAFTVFGLVTIPVGSSLTLITAVDAFIGGVTLVEALAEKDCKLNAIWGDQKQTKAGLKWDYCNSYPITSTMAQYQIRIPLDDSVTVKMKIKAGDGGGQYPAKETCIWTLDYNGDGKIPMPTAEKKDT